MAEPAEKIIIYASFDNVIMANLVKTKLDAYGIPCFLTGESFTNLYPIRNEIFPGTRVHIFEKDREQVDEILTEESAPSPKKVVPCPQCLSTNVAFEESEKGYLSRLFISWFLHAFGQTPLPRTSVYHCNNCGTEF
jgi:hypothetical protein